MITALDKNTALVLIDLQQSSISTPKAHPLNEVLDNVNKLIAAFKRKKLSVVVVNVKPSGAAWIKARKDVKMPPYPADETIYKIIDKIHVNEDDIYITKHTWNAFFETALDDELKKRAITGIVLAGISTSIGVEGTARAASELGYNISFALNAMTDNNATAHERSIEFIFPRIGETGVTDDIIKMLEDN